MVEPMRMGLLHLQQGVLGGQDIISVGYLEDNKALKAHGGASTWLNHRVSTGWTKWFYSPRKYSVWTGSKGFYIGRVEAKRHFAGLWLQKGVLPAMMVALRRVFDRFSSVSRSTFVALSFVFRLFLVRSSIGLR